MVTLLSKVKKGLSKTRRTILGRFDEAVQSGKQGEELLDELEEILILSDVGFDTTLYLMEQLKNRLGIKGSVDPQLIKQNMVEIIRNVLEDVEKPLAVSPPYPFTILVVGVNGSGKTTTIGKIAHGLKQKGHSVMLGAGDTFRAAAIEQLEIWGSRAEVEVVKHKPGGDSSAVAFDTIQSARSKKSDVVIIDTAGRLHTRKNLMDELEKVKRVIKKELPHAPSEILLVLDATTGQNSINQARSFNESLGVTGLAVTKIDGTAKGGVLLAITREIKIPVRFIGIGEGIDDLKPFRSADFARALLFDE
jgi:fused signal recognition particle receptor